jgi:EmrB/QacA subfamily drug resistance transporter
MSDSTERDSKKSVLIVTTLSSFLTPLSLATVNVALPSIGKYFAVDAITLSWVATTYLLTAAMFLVPFGKISDMFGRKKIFIYGMWIFTVASFCLGISPSANMLIFFRALQGVGASMIFGTGVAILSSVYPPGERGQAIGINIAAVYLGLSCGPFFGGLLTQHFGWRSIFFFNVPLGIFVIFLSMRNLKQEWAEAKGESFDLTGSLIYSLTLLLIMYGFSHLPSLRGLLLIISGMVGIPIFVWWEARTKNPILDIRLFMNNKVFTLSNVAALLNYSATFAVGFLLSLYLQYLKGLSPQNTGFILVSQPIVQAAFSPLAGKLSDRLEPRLVASSGMALTALGLIFLAFLDAGTTLLLIVVNLMFLGLSFAFFSSPNTNAIMSSVENRFYGVASSTLATMRLLGQMLSMGIATLIFAVYIGRVEISPPYYGLLLKGTKIAFAIFGALCVVGVFASLSRGKLR